MSGRDAHFQNSTARITTSATTVVQSTGNPGVLDGVIVGKAGSAGNLVTCQNSGGTALLVVDGANIASHRGLNIAFTDGLTVVTSATTDPDVTILYR